MKKGAVRPPEESVVRTLAGFQIPPESYHRPFEVKQLTGAVPTAGRHGLCVRDSIFWHRALCGLALHERARSVFEYRILHHASRGDLNVQVADYMSRCVYRRAARADARSFSRQRRGAEDPGCGGGDVGRLRGPRRISPTTAALGEVAADDTTPSILGS